MNLCDRMGDFGCGKITLNVECFSLEVVFLIGMYCCGNETNRRHSHRHCHLIKSEVDPY